MELLFTALQTIKTLLEFSRGIEGADLMEKHIEFLRDQIEKLGKAQADGEQKHREAEEKIRELETELAKSFLSYSGALFKRLPDGRLDSAIYCPRCRVSTDPFTGFTCRQPGCNWRSGLHADELPIALSRVADAYKLEIAPPLFDPKRREEQAKEKQPRLRTLSHGVFRDF